MAHLEQQILDAVKTLLTGLATTADRVYIGRTRPLGNDYEPTLLIYAVETISRAQSESRPRTMVHTMTMRVEGRVITPTEPDSALHQIKVEIIVAMASVARIARTSDGKYITLGITPTKTQQKTEAVGDQHEGAVGLDYSIIYSSKENDPENPA